MIHPVASDGALEENPDANQEPSTEASPMQEPVSSCKLSLTTAFDSYLKLALAKTHTYRGDGGMDQFQISIANGSS
jgi:hypothetical protein